MAKEKLYEYKTIKSLGARHYLIKLKGEENWKHHRWDGPAIVPLTNSGEFKKSYYLYGIEYDEDSYNEALSQREGLPWYKQSGANIRH